MGEVYHISTNRMELNLIEEERNHSLMLYTLRSKKTLNQFEKRAT